MFSISTIRHSKKREFLELIYLILKAVQDKPLRFTHIMHRAEVDSRVAKKLVTLLVEKGLLEVVNAEGKLSKLYRITEKGMRYIEVYEKLMNLLLEKAEVKEGEK